MKDIPGSVELSREREREERGGKEQFCCDRASVPFTFPRMGHLLLLLFLLLLLDKQFESVPLPPSVKACRWSEERNSRKKITAVVGRAKEL